MYPEPNPNGSCDPGPGLAPPFSGPSPSSRSGSSPAEKPKGWSGMPSTVPIGGAARAIPGHAVSEPPSGRARTLSEGVDGACLNVAGVTRRTMTLMVALVPILVFGVLLAIVTVPFVSLGPGPTFNTLGEYDGKQVVDIE